MPPCTSRLTLKIDYQTYFTSCEPQVREELRAVHAFKSLDGFHLDDDKIFDQDVQTITDSRQRLRFKDCFLCAR
jgi:hypothetical protein